MDALVRCLAFDAVTTRRVFSLERYAREQPMTPAEDVLSAGEQGVTWIVVRPSGCCRRTSVTGRSGGAVAGGSCC